MPATVGESKPKFTATWINIACAIFSSIGAFIFGFDSGIFNTTIAHATFNLYMFHNTAGNPILIGAVASTYTAGTAIGAFFSGWSTDRFGRKRCIIAAAATVTLGTAIQTAAVNVGMLIAGRIIAGLAVGVLLSIVPVYNAELALPQYRGVIVGLFAVMASFGVLTSNWIGYSCAYASGNAQWRIPLGCQIPVAIVLLAGGWFLPESPRWLIEKDRGQEAYKVMMRIHGAVGEDFVNREFTQMHEQIAAESGARETSFLDLLRTPSARKRMYLGIFINVFNNLGGTPVISVYQSKLFQEIGFVGNQTLFLSGFYGMAGFAGVITNIFFVADRLGRRQSMWMEAVALIIDLAILMALTDIYTGSGNRAGEAAAVTFIFLHSYVYSVFCYGTVWVYTTEIFPTHLRAKGTAVCTFWGQAFGILLQQIGLLVFQDIGYLFYIVFIVCTTVAGLVYYFLIIETKGATLEDISAFFGDEVVVMFDESSGRVKEVLNDVAATNGGARDGEQDKSYSGHFEVVSGV